MPKKMSRAEECALEERRAEKARENLVRAMDVTAQIALAAKRLAGLRRNGNISETIARLHAVDGAASRLLVEMMIRSMTPMERDDFHLDLTGAVRTVPPNRTAQAILRRLAADQLTDELP